MKYKNTTKGVSTNLPARCVEKQRLLCRSVRVIEARCNVVEGCVVVVVVVVVVLCYALELVAILLVDGRPACGRVELLATPAGMFVKLSRLSMLSTCQVVKIVKIVKL